MIESGYDGAWPRPPARGAGLRGRPAGRPADGSRQPAGTGSQSPGPAGGRPDARDGRPGQAASLPSGTLTSDSTGSASPDGPASAVDLLPSVTLPKGGGAIRGMDEKLSVNAATGTASMTVPLPLSPGRSGFTPSLSLGYDSGSGNGPFGFGWSLAVPSITRQTDKGLPLYRDGEESDVFVLAGAEDLVPVLGQSGRRTTLSRTVYGIPFQIACYRPRVEGLFSRIERWTAAGTGVSHWRTITRDNVTTLYGADPGSTIANPADPAQIFSWKICRSWDDLCIFTVSGYTAEDSAGIDQAAAHEANRTAA